MKVLSVIQADLDLGGQGLPSLHAEEIGGESVLRRTVRRVCEAELPDGCVVLARGDDEAAEVASLVAGLPVEIVTLNGGDVPQRDVLRRSRRWSRSGWRGGIGGTTVFDEHGTPARLLALARSTGADAVVEVPPSAPLFESRTIDDLLRWLIEDGSRLEFYFASLPPGLACAVYSQSVLEKLTSGGGTIYEALRYHPGRYERDPIEGKACFGGDDALRMAPFRLLADSPRTLERLRAIDDSDSVTAVRRLKACPHLWPGSMPGEVAFEIASASVGTDPYAALSGSVEMTEFMDLAAFQSALCELRDAGDVNVTFGVWGDPLAHPEVFEFIDSARRAGAFGLHVATSGRWLTEEIVERLAASELDAVSVRLWGNTEGTYERVTGRRDFERVTRLVERLIERRALLGRSTPFVLPEMTKSMDSLADVEGFFDRWIAKADWPVIRGFNDFAGQVEDRDVLRPYPAGRFPCRQLFERLTVTPSGDAVVCGQDLRRKCCVGNVFRQSIGEVWHGGVLESLRRGHVAGDYSGSELCAACRHWYQL